MTRIHAALATLAAATAALSATHARAEFDLPPQIAWTAYDTGSTGFGQAVAIGAALKNEADVDLRVLPGKNDIARAAPLRQGRVPFSAFGVGVYMMQEGVFDFANEDWGPQPVRVVMTNFAGTIGQAIGVAADAGIETYADLRGKRVAYIKGAPAINVNIEAYLAYAGLTWEDVKKVEFGGYADSLNALGANQVDAAFGSTTASGFFQAEASPRGLVWPPIDPDDEEAVSRMLEVAPYFRTMTATEGAAAAGTDEGAPTAGYPYPALITMADQDADLVYNMTKAMVELYPDYQGKAPGIDGWALDKQSFQWVVPYHEGAIRFFKEAGVWSEEARAHNDQLIQRQEALAAAWEKLRAEDPEDWDAAWAEARREALKAGGFKVVF